MFRESTHDRHLLEIYLGLVLCFLHFFMFQKDIELIFLSFISLDLSDLHNVLCINLFRLYFSIACGVFFFLSQRKIIFCDYNHLLCPCVSFSIGDAYVFRVPLCQAM